MKEATTIDIRPLSLADAHDLAPLIAAYVQELNRGAPRRPDDYYAELLLRDGTARLTGAHRGDDLIGFALWSDLPDTVSGKRIGQLDELFVLQDARGLGVEHALIDALIAEGRRRGWHQIRWLMREKAQLPKDRFAPLLEPAGIRLHILPVDRTGN
jgi:GNAT superfamily N-acetyltransferase